VAARKLLTLVYYGLRDGEIRSLSCARGIVTGGRGQETASSISAWPPFHLLRISESHRSGGVAFQAGMTTGDVGSNVEEQADELLGGVES